MGGPPECLRLSVLAVFVGVAVGVAGCSRSVQKTPLERFAELKSANTQSEFNELIAACDSVLAEFADSSTVYDSLRSEVLYAKAVALYSAARTDVALEVFAELQDILPPSLACTEIAIISNLWTGYTHLVQDDFKDAERDFVRAIEMSEQCGAEGRGRLGRAYVQLANVLAKTGHLDSALRVAQRGKAIAEEEAGEYSRSAANATNTVGLVYEEQGDFVGAESAYRHSSAIYERLGADRLWPTALGSLGWLLIAKGDRYAALECFRQAKSVLDATSTPTDYVYFRVTTGLALTLLEIGETQKAERMLDNSISLIRSRKDLSDFSSVAEALSVLAKTYLGLAEYDKANQCITQGLHILSGPDFEKSANAGLFYELQARIQRQTGRLKDAEQLINKAINIYDTVYGKDDIRILSALTEKALIAHGRSDYRVEEYLYHDIERIAKSASDISFVSADALEAVAQYKRGTGAADEALWLLNTVVIAKSKRIQAALDGLQEEQAIRFFASLKKSVDLLISVALENKTDIQRYAKEIIDAVLVSKAITTESLLKRGRRLRVLQSLSTSEEFESLERANARVSNILNSSITSQGRRGEDRVERALNDLTEVRADLMRRNLELKELFEQDETNFEALREKIGNSRNVLLEYFKFRTIARDGKAGEFRYIAYTIGVSTIEKTCAVRLYDMGSATPIDSLVRQYRGHMAKVAQEGHFPDSVMYNSYVRLSKVIYNRLLRQPLKQVGSPLLLIISPDDELYLLPFGSLVDESGKYLIERMPVHYVSSARAVMNKSRVSPAISSALIVANPDLAYLANPRKRNQKAPRTARSEIDSSKCIDLARIAGRRLPFSESNARTLRSELTGQSVSVKVLEGSSATEGSFKDSAPSFNILHLATHGYFLDPDCLTELFPLNDGPPRISKLSLSGILLSRTGKSATNSGVIEDGVLTTAEVSSLNLSGVRLVTLSSCESGVGLTAPGETVYGLRRSFLIAGAQTVVSALWEVDDRSSATVFGSLYENDIENLAKKMQSIKVKSIAELRRNGFNTHPFSWGGFISFGDWR